jgi:hypothetical protein
MEQFNDWHSSWEEFLLSHHGKAEVQTEDDLYLQVGKTANRKPVSKEIFNKIANQNIDDLSLSPNDILVDFCCGNGLFTYEQIIGIDFSQKIIDTANKYKQAPNISYCLGNVVDYMKAFKTSWPGVVPDKYLMIDSLAYFAPVDLQSLLAAIVAVSGRFKFLVRGIPNDLLKWNYYNTEARKQFYYANCAKGDFITDGIGRWWIPDEIMMICGQLKLNCIIRTEELPISDFRMNVIISNY